MQVEICYNDSLTGEPGGSVYIAEEFTGEAILQVFKLGDDDENYRLDAWVLDVHGTSAAFILKHTGNETYLDGFVVAGIAYLLK
jgi:hypothetical protein